LDDVGYLAASLATKPPRSALPPTGRVTADAYLDTSPRQVC
jgi:hypothetical protein